MKVKELSDNLKKNLLDIHYNRYLSYSNNCIIFLFTYIIAILIGFITNQIDYRNLNQIFAVGVVSFFVINVIVLLLLNFRVHLKKIVKEMKKLGI